MHWQFVKAWNMCKIFSLVPSKKTCHQRKTETNWWMIKLTKTQILPNCQGSNTYFCINLRVIYNYSAFGSSYFYVSFSRDKKTERIERKFKTQNSNPRQLPWHHCLCIMQSNHCWTSQFSCQTPHQIIGQSTYFYWRFY